jgi:hypothetical protein
VDGKITESDVNNTSNCDLFTCCVFSEWESICLFVFRYQLLLHLLAVLYSVYKC